MAHHVTVKLLIVDDHPLFRQGVRMALSHEEEIQIVGEAGSGEEALTFLSTVLPNQEPNVALVDLNLPGINGLELTRKIRSQYPRIRVVMLSIHENDEQAFHALQAGAADYKSKEINPKQLVAILRRVARGDFPINDMVEEPRVATLVLTEFRNQQKMVQVPESEFTVFTPLSEREIEVLERIAMGGSNKEIADTLGISTQTVKNHISSILRKLSLNDRTQAVLYALRRGWIETPPSIRVPLPAPDAPARSGADDSDDT